MGKDAAMSCGHAVTVVIATRNRADTLLATLGRLVALAERPPIIVVDNDSADGTVERTRAAFPSVRTVSLPCNLGGAARNCGVALAGTPFVAFSDDDSWWAPGALTTAVTAARGRPHAGLVAARVLVGDEERMDPVSVAMATSPLGDRVVGFLACAAMVRREAFLAVGGFDFRLGIGGEEELFALNLAAAGWDCVYVNEVVAHHHPGPRMADDARQRRQACNALLVATMRRRGWAAVHRWSQQLRGGATDPVSRGAIADTLGHLRWAVTQRRPVAPAVEQELRAVSGSLTGSD